MQEAEGLFNNLTYERVRLNLGRPIGDRQPELDGRGEEGRGHRSWGSRRRRCHCRGGGLAGVFQSTLRCMVFKSDGIGMKRRERRPRPCHFRGRGKSRTALTMAGSGESSPEFAKLALEVTIRHGRWMGRKRRERRSLPSEKHGAEVAQR
jgi:hypothetical protein